MLFTKKELPWAKRVAALRASASVFPHWTKFGDGAGEPSCSVTLIVQHTSVVTLMQPL